MTITMTTEDNVAVITIDDGKANAVSPDFLATITPLLDEAEANAGAIVIAGRPGLFSAGFDLNTMRSGDMAAIEALIDGGGVLALRLFESPLPIVAACTGHAMAMGGFLLLASDTRIGAAGDFKLGFNETAINMVLPHFGPTFAKARLAPTYFTRSIVQGELFDPQTAVAAGLLDHVVGASDVLPIAKDKAKAMSELPRGAYHGNKLLMRRAAIDALKAKTPLG